MKKLSHRGRAGLVTAIIFAGAASCFGESWAASDDMQIAAEIDNKSLIDALVELSRQGQMQLVIRSDVMPPNVVRSLHGHMMLGAALDILLEGTGFGYRMVGNHTIAIVDLGSGAQDVSYPAESRVIDVDEDSRVPESPEDTRVDERCGRGNTMRKTTLVSRIATFLGVCSAIAATGSANAQEAGPSGGADLEEIIVTATRQEASVNKIALSITALTQGALEQQGIHTAQDLSAAVPALRITPPATNGVQISIRGISSSQGAATTGVYLDDTPLQRRGGSGAVNGIGVALPQLFDLSRVEVLRGPQGTLYGGSSEGGTVRFITPTPSLSEYSGMARAEINSVSDGGMGYEVGGALGVPLAEGKAGLRVSLWGRHDPGYIDHISRFTGNRLATDTNSKDYRAAQLKLLWKVTDNISVTPAYYGSRMSYDDADQSWQNVGQFTQAARYYSATGTPTTPELAAFTYPAHAYGPYDMWGANRSGMNQCVYADALANADNDQCPAYYKQKNVLNTPSVSFDYLSENFSIKAITSYVEQRNSGYQPMFTSSLGTANGGNPFVFNLPYMHAQYGYKTRQTQWIEEIRASSANSAARLQWVAGIFVSSGKSVSASLDRETADAYVRVLKGVPLTPTYGPTTELYTDPDVYSWRNQTLREDELAAFGEASYFFTEKFKATLGLRVSQTKFRYDLAFGGPAVGFLVPDNLNGGLASGKVKETPLTPKFGLSYQATPDNLFYLTVAKGFRSGGVNNQPPAARCASDVAALGVESTPQTFGSDSVWSYEGGAKVRIGNGRAQVNTSVYLIDWDAPQTTFGLPTCGFSYVINAGHAQSKGADLQAQVLLWSSLTASVSLAYMDAKYTESLVGPEPSNTVFVSKGELLAGAPWTGNIGLYYRLNVGERPAYLRGDYRYSSSYRSGKIWPSTGYSPDGMYTGETRQLNVRAGMKFGQLDFAVFADNVTNSQDIMGPSYPDGRRSGCADSGCSTYRAFFPVTPVTMLKPRTIGVSLSYEY